MDKYKNKYRIPSARFQNWDYRWAGSYFITICTQNREHYFGECVNGKMQLSHVGIIADILWHQIPHHAQNLELGAFVVMPNHIHGVLIITQNGDGNVDGDGNENGNGNGVGAVETGHALSLPTSNAMSNDTSHPTSNETTNPTSNDAYNEPPNNPSEQPKTIGQQRFQNIGKNSISSIVGSYKSAVTKHAHRLDFEFHWQTRFHDHIIRDDKSFQIITNYIIKNPSKWCDDKFYH